MIDLTEQSLGMSSTSELATLMVLSATAVLLTPRRSEDEQYVPLPNDRRAAGQALPDEHSTRIGHQADHRA